MFALSDFCQTIWLGACMWALDGYPVDDEATRMAKQLRFVRELMNGKDIVIMSGARGGGMSHALDAARYINPHRLAKAIDLKIP